MTNLKLGVQYESRGNNIKKEKIRRKYIKVLRRQQKVQIKGERKEKLEG